MIRRLGLIQIDYVNVLVPAHYLVLFSRLGPYRRPLLDQLVYQRREFTEQWAHEASIVPVDHWPLLEHRRATHRVRPWGFERFLAKQSQYAQYVFDQVRERGALTADDLADPDGAPRRMADKWGFGLAVKRQVLEAHFGFGRFAVAGRRQNFARAYDLAERVIPAQHWKTVEREDQQRGLLRVAARAHGVATAGDLADYYRMSVRDARPRIAELLESGELRAVRIEGWREPAYLHAEAPPAAPIEAAALLSPFDPIIWTRPRTARLFDFDYALEIFVPQEKRKWGYYVLPFLLGDRLAARVDLKADRNGRRLLVLAAYLERWAKAKDVTGRLAAELRTLAGWLDLDTVVVSSRGNLARALNVAVRARGARATSH